MTSEFDALASQIEEVQRCSKENHRALRGSNGEVGLVGKVGGIEKSIDNLKQSDLPLMEARLMVEIKKLQEKSVLWPVLARGLVAPVTLAVIISVVITLINRFFF
jgi:hypothetical protein